MNEQHVILALAWIAYCVLHSVFASLFFKQRVKGWMGNHYKFYRLYYSLFAFLGFVAIIYYLLILPSVRIFQPTNLTSVVGGLLMAKGGVIMSVCIAKYFFQLSGLRSLVEEKKTNQLMITGIHKYVRHPLYAGTFVFIWGLWILIPSLALMISNIIITVYTLVGIRFEEIKLENEFGESYRQYKKQVPMIIPKM